MLCAFMPCPFMLRAFMLFQTCEQILANKFVFKPPSSVRTGLGFDNTELYVRCLRRGRWRKLIVLSMTAQIVKME